MIDRPIFPTITHKVRAGFAASIIGALCVLLTAATAGAQSISQAQLSALGHKEYEVREQAMHKLLQDQRLTARDVVDAFPRARTPEQRHRLMSVAWHHLLREQRDLSRGRGIEGAIGINLSAVPRQQLANNRQAAIVVVNTSPGFPGYAHLRPHDLIIAINGEPLPQLPRHEEVQQHFVRAIERMAPGSDVRLTVNRSGRVVEETFALADKSHLEAMYRHITQGILPGQQPELWTRLQQEMMQHMDAEQPLNFRLPEARRMKLEAAQEEFADLSQTQRRVRLMEQMAQLQRDHMAGRLTAEQLTERLHQLQAALDRQGGLPGPREVRIQRTGRVFPDRDGVEVPIEVLRELEKELDGR